MDEQQDGAGSRVLQALYQHYLQQTVNLVEENTRLRLRVAELEQAQSQEEES